MKRLLVAFVFMSMSTSMATAQREDAPRSPVTHCVYNNRVFSPGAVICISKSHYQQCVAGKVDSRIPQIQCWRDGRMQKPTK